MPFLSPPCLPLPPLSGKQPLISFLSYIAPYFGQFIGLDSHKIWIFVTVFFIWPDDFKVHPGCSMYPLEFHSGKRQNERKGTSSPLLSTFPTEESQRAGGGILSLTRSPQPTAPSSLRKCQGSSPY